MSTVHRGFIAFFYISVMQKIATIILMFAFGLSAATPMVVGAQTYYGGNYLILSTYYAAPGETITVHGYRFYPREAVTVQMGTASRRVQAEASGHFATSFIVPHLGTASENRIAIRAVGDVSGTPRTSQLVVKGFYAWIALSQYYARAGSTVTVQGHGFGANEIVHIYWQGTEMGETQTTASGRFSFNLRVPTGGMGIREVRAHGTSSQAQARTLFYQAP
jgi:hypothetical protein